MGKCVRKARPGPQRYGMASGSIRIPSPPPPPLTGYQERLFKALGLSPRTVRKALRFFLAALTYGTPPHGGIALGIDRVVISSRVKTPSAKSSPSGKYPPAQDFMAGPPREVDTLPSSQLGLRPRSRFEGAVFLLCRLGLRLFWRLGLGSMLNPFVENQATGQ